MLCDKFCRKGASCAVLYALERKEERAWLFSLKGLTLQFRNIASHFLLFFDTSSQSLYTFTERVSDCPRVEEFVSPGTETCWREFRRWKAEEVMIPWTDGFNICLLLSVRPIPHMYYCLTGESHPCALETQLTKMSRMFCDAKSAHGPSDKGSAEGSEFWWGGRPAFSEAPLYLVWLMTYLWPEGHRWGWRPFSKEVTALGKAQGPKTMRHSQTAMKVC